MSASGRRRDDKDLDPREFLESVYPNSGLCGMTAPPPDAAADERRLNLARIGAYYGEPKSRQHPELETLSGVMQLRQQNDRIERLPAPAKDAPQSAVLGCASGSRS